MKTRLIVSSGQYEQAAITVTVNHKTWSGLCRRITQLEKKHAVYGDNWAGWIKARVALADADKDRWWDNVVIGGRWCSPGNGWLTEHPDIEESMHMTYPELKATLGL